VDSKIYNSLTVDEASNPLMKLQDRLMKLRDRLAKLQIRLQRAGSLSEQPRIAADRLAKLQIRLQRSPDPMILVFGTRGAV
jgi:hypothetical protein